MDKIWGVTEINGSGVITRYPPDRAPAYAGIPDAAGRMATQAIADIKAATGEDVPRGKIMIAPLTQGRTSQPYLAGNPPPYSLSWWGKDEKIHTYQIPWTADPAAMKADVTAANKEQFDADSARAANERRPAEAARKAVDAQPDYMPAWMKAQQGVAAGELERDKIAGEKPKRKTGPVFEVPEMTPEGVAGGADAMLTGGR